MDDSLREDEIRFALEPDIALNTRIKLIGALILVGLALQMFVNVFAGWIFVAAGAALGIIQGRNIHTDVSVPGKWENATVDELKAIRELSGRIGDWRSRTDFFNPKSTPGFMTVLYLFSALAFCAILIYLLIDRQSVQMGAGFFSLIPPARGGLITPIFALNAITMVVPVLFFGRMTAWEPPELPRKANYLLHILDQHSADGSLEFVPSLYVHKEEEDASVPTDCRMLVKLKDAPEDFIGIQIQVSMNDVQGTKYPYCYAVVIAGKPFEIYEKVSRHLNEPADSGWLGRLTQSKNDQKEAAFKRFNQSIVEVSSESDVDVLVVRQVTKGSGYHTTENQAAAVFADALELSRTILG